MPLSIVFQYPWQEQPRAVKTALTTSSQDEMSKIRARNALKILLDVHGDFGRRAAGAGSILPRILSPPPKA